MKEQFEHFRPDGFIGKGDKFLFPLIGQLEQKIAQLNRRFRKDTFDFDEDSSFIFSSLLVEFAEDLHNDYGLWSSIEHFNNEMFGTPLPTVIKRKEQITECFDVNRIKFFIINILDLFHEDFVISPKNDDLGVIARSVSNFFIEKFETIPKDSGIKHFLQQPNEYAWDVKKKLVWASTKSYLFRYDCFAYVNEKNKSKEEDSEIPVLDDFICQERTKWSGLGVIDIVVQALDLDEKKKKDVRLWYERHISFYQLKEINGKIVHMENLINNQTYQVHIFEELREFMKDEVFMGALVPFGDYYYWSGEQNVLGKLSAEEIREVKNNFIEKASHIVYRYDKDLLAKAVKLNKERYDDFVSLYKDDLVTFKDGLSMAAAFQKYDRQKLETLSKEELKTFMERNNLDNPFPKMDIPDFILESDREIGVYYNQFEGTEMIIEFDDVINGLQKHLMKLKEDEKEAIWQLITSNNISVNFVNKLIGKYGSNSIATTFFIDNEPNLIDYLLHKYKGHFYLNRYPFISFSEDED